MTDPYNVGTITVTNGGTTVTGTGTFWVGSVRKNDMLFDPAQGLMARVTADPTSNTSLAITAWPGTGLTGAAYEIIPAADSTTNTARLRELLSDLTVVKANGRGLFFNFRDSVTDADPGAGYIRLNNADPTLATAAYVDVLDANGATVSAILDSWDDQATAAARGQLWIRGIADPSAFHGYKVTGSVVDGTGYRKVTLTYIGGSGSFAADDELMVAFSAQGADGTNAILGVWQGAWVTATAYDVDDLVEEAGSTYICVEAHTSGTFATDLAAAKWELAVEKGDTGATGPTGDTGPTGPKGINWQGDYSGATAYVEDDGVLYNGSSWRALGATTGNSPPTLPTTSNAYWQLLARQGTDGAGTVASLVEGDGIAVDNTDPTAPIVSIDDGGVTNAKMADMAQATIKGRAAGAGTGAPVDLTPAQAREAIGLKWEPIALDTVSDVAAWSRTDLGEYRFLRLKFKARPATNGAFINVRTSTSNGSSYDSTAGDYSTINVIGNGSTVTSGQSTAESALTLNGGGNTAPAAAVQTVEFTDFNKATYCFMESRGSSYDNSGTKAVDTRNGFRVQSTARNAIQVSFNTGNIADGWFFLEGVKG